MCVYVLKPPESFQINFKKRQKSKFHVPKYIGHVMGGVMTVK